MTDNPHDFALYLNDNLSEVDLDEALAALSPQRREQAMKLGYAEGGKPFIVGHEHIHFNMSHCRQAAVCVLSDEEIGVDIEEIRRFKPSLVDYTMNDAQRQMIAAAEHPEVEFIRLWTMKEALLKLTGLGLRTDLKTLDLSGYRFTTRVETQKGYVCTVCQK